MSFYGANANVSGTLTTSFSQLPSMTWNNNNMALAFNWQALNVSNFTQQTWMPASPGITWTGTNITLPYFGIYAITMNARIASSGVFIQVVLNTATTGNGATANMPTNNTASEAYVLAAAGHANGPSCGACAVVPLNAGSVITPLIYCQNATTSQYIQINVTLLQRLQ